MENQDLKRSGSLTEVDYRSLVSRADLYYSKPVDRSEEGMPVGNGRMGSLVWTTPDSLRFQINRVDVFASNCATNSFPERHSDYCGGCGFVDIEFWEDVFTGEYTSQHLSCYDGLVTVEGKYIKAQVLAWNEQDVMAVEIDNRREQPTAIRTNLRMLRPAMARTGSHVSMSELEIREDKLILTQEFVEDNYYCSSVVVIGIVGQNTRARFRNDAEVQLIAEPGNGSFTILMASAASFDPEEDIIASTLAQLESAAAEGYARLVESNKKWWHNFWSRAFVYLHSDDGIADYIQENYTYYLYVMASASRGKYPPKFNGMLWTTGGDTRKWGSQYWGANQSCLYNALFPANRLELMDPMFSMYTGMYDSCALAAKQQWDSKGIYIPETVAFDGLEELPDDIAEEMSDLYLLRRPWDDRSERFRDYVLTKQPHSSRWNWKEGGRWRNGRWHYTERECGPYGPVTHIFSRGAKIAYKYWLRYEYTNDREWLRDRAYPMLKGVAEFYRNYPNLKKGSDGKYHIHDVNSNEPVWGGQDTDEEISAMMGILPVAIKASEILDVDAELRLVWQELLDNLAPLPRRLDGSPIWMKALEPVVKGRSSAVPDHNTMPMWYFDLCNLETEDQEITEIANATFESYFHNGIDSKTRVGVLSKLPVAAAILGRSGDIKFLIPNQIQSMESPVLANRMTLREGVQTTSFQRIGRAADALHMALCQSVPAGPSRTPIIRVFPAWPREWDAAFRLLVRGAFLVSASMQKGQIEFVEIQPQTGGECHLRNPWPNAVVTLYRDGEKAGNISGSLLKFPTKRDEIIAILPEDSVPVRWIIQ